MHERAAGPEIVYQDDHLLVVDKPPGLPTTSPPESRPSLTDWARTRVRSDARLHPTSRLDAMVSGLVTFSLTARANRELLHARRRTRYNRRYIGITVKAVDFSVGDWDWPVSLDPQNPRRRIAGSGRAERGAHTRCALIERAPHGTVLRFEPTTGRTHQIRVHAQRAGVPLFGDHLYGGERRFTLPDGSVVTASRVMLHCAHVSFPDPGGSDRLSFTARPRPDMEHIWASLGGSPGALQG